MSFRSLFSKLEVDPIEREAEAGARKIKYSLDGAKKSVGSDP